MGHVDMGCSDVNWFMVVSKRQRQ